MAKSYEQRAAEADSASRAALSSSSAKQEHAEGARRSTSSACERQRELATSSA